MDVIAEYIGNGPPNVMPFADDLMVCEDNREAVEEQLDKLRYTMKSNGLRVSRNKSEYLLQHTYEEQAVRLGENRLPKVKPVKYLGAAITYVKGGSTSDCRNRVCLKWNKWRVVTAVFFFVVFSIVTVR